METFVLMCVALLADNSVVVLDMDEPSYRDVLFGTGSARVTSLTMVPKPGVLATDNAPFRPLVMNIPDGATPVLKTRFKALMFGDASLRIYGVGYAENGREFLAWVLPDGSIEIGPDSGIADAMLAGVI